jgi:putative membrane protein
MQAWLADGYLWIKALHIIALIAWMAGMLYLPRLYVYHCETEPGSAESERFKLMERRLLRLIVNPAMIATWIFGLALAWAGELWSQGWLHAKLTLLVLMQIVHACFSRWRRDFAADRNRRPARFYRIMNEVPTLLLIGIVILAVVKPF